MLETIIVIVSFKMWLPSSFVLCIYLRLNLKVNLKLISLVEETTGLPGIDGVIWLLVTIFMLFYNGNKQIEKKETQIYSLERKGVPGY